MSFFKKNGRPTDEEQALIQAIERLRSEKAVGIDQIPDGQTLDDLIAVKRMLDAYPEVQEAEEVPFDDNIDEGDDTEAAPEPETMLDDPNESETEPETDFDDPEPGRFIADDYDPFADPIIERSYTGAQGNLSEGEPDGGDGLELEDSNTGNLKDLNPATKRRAAEQTADALLKGYARLAPQPFKWVAKFPEAKIEKMVFKGEIDPELEVSDGVTFDEYMRQTNAQLDEIFKVQEETIEEIREPLIEVLMEQQLELTPTQRLTMAVISHLAQMFTVAIQLRGQNNRILNYQRHLTNLARAKAA